MVIDGEEQLLGHWNLGRVDLITEQLAACNRRLVHGLPSILRSGVLGRQSRRSQGGAGGVPADQER